MHYYNAKSKVIMKGRRSRGVRRSRSRKRSFIKRTCRSKSRCGGAVNNRHVELGGGGLLPGQTLFYKTHLSQ
jgi:hypothetical protein